MKNLKNYLILGGCGFIGRHLVKELSENNPESFITVVDVVKDSGYEKFGNVEQIQSSLSQIKNFDKLLLNVDIVYHLVSTTTPSDNTEKIMNDFNDTIIPTIHLLQCMKLYTNKKVIFVSSGGTVYGEAENSPIPETHSLNPVCTYGTQKVILEKYIEVYGHLHNVDYIIARLSNPYGTGQNIKKNQGIIPIFVRKILNYESLQIWGDGNTVRDYIFIDDAIGALQKLGNYKGNEHIFNIGSGVGYSINEIVNLIVKELEVEMPQVEYLDSRKCDVKENILDISKIVNILNWKPEVSIEDGILQTIKLHKDS
ncbi:NAD-dependent epimerase/dehydratase family protein [Clostridium sp. ZS6]|uniref:NAD-dependent epimerase/dehydratase family protein n=1 Tax=Clostridium sp. ZS6 TaxID=2949987 RepID=UPI002079BE73|nr:NAD-dependent epimerase/dehydratase family protein [Clostridium sp. ZS6]